MRKLRAELPVLQGTEAILACKRGTTCSAPPDFLPSPLILSRERFTFSTGLYVAVRFCMKAKKADTNESFDKIHSLTLV